jgi:hypothetical protein
MGCQHRLGLVAGGLQVIFGAEVIWIGGLVVRVAVKCCRLCGSGGRIEFAYRSGG